MKVGIWENGQLVKIESNHTQEESEFGPSPLSGLKAPTNLSTLIISTPASKNRNIDGGDGAKLVDESQISSLRQELQ